MTVVICKIIILFLITVTILKGPYLNITNVARLQMGAYLCIASNGVQPSVSKRIVLNVNCKYKIQILLENEIYSMDD